MMRRPQVNSKSKPVIIPIDAPAPALKADRSFFLAKIISANKAPKKGMNRRPTIGENRILPMKAPIIAPHMPAIVLPNLLAPRPPDILSTTNPPATSNAKTVHSHHDKGVLPMIPCQMHPIAMMIMPGSMGISVPISPMPNSNRVMLQTSGSDISKNMSFLTSKKIENQQDFSLAFDVRKIEFISCFLSKVTYFIVPC